MIFERIILSGGCPSPLTEKMMTVKVYQFHLTQDDLALLKKEGWGASEKTMVSRLRPCCHGRFCGLGGGFSVDQPLGKTRACAKALTDVQRISGRRIGNGRAVLFGRRFWF